MKVYNTFKVIETIPEVGQVIVEWINENDPEGPRLVRSHIIPIEAEIDNWSEAQLREFLSFEAEDVPDIPEWMVAEEKMSHAKRIDSRQRREDMGPVNGTLVAPR